MPRFLVLLMISTAMLNSFIGQDCAAEPDSIAAFMHQPADRGDIWWRDGFPTMVKGAPWQRCIQTPRYAFVLDTKRIQVPHLGRSGSPLHELPSADLRLRLTVDGKTYRCKGGVPWSRFGGPRLVEAGHFFQRADVNGLEFEADDGTRLDAEARFETAAWPDQLMLALAVRPRRSSRDTWRKVVMEIELQQGERTLRSRWESPPDQVWPRREWRQATLQLDPVDFTGGPATAAPAPRVRITASELGSNGQPKRGARPRPVTYEAAIGWHRVNLDGVEPLPAPRSFRSAAAIANTPRDARNDALERVRLRLENPSDQEQLVRLMLEKTRRGIGHGPGSSITGISAILRDADGHPTGIPVQLSKNWHDHREGGAYSGQWFHGITQLRLPPGVHVFELVLAYGHWGGIPAASHAQLSLVGWGNNQRWEQSAIGAWGESICYEPAQGQAGCTITDVRALMLRAPGRSSRNAFWKWTGNSGGGDFLRLFDPAGDRRFHARMRVNTIKQGPCLTEVALEGLVHKTGIRHSATVSLARSDDLTIGTYQIRMKVVETTPFSRLALFQIGTDNYAPGTEANFAFGNADGLIKQWAPPLDREKNSPIRCDDAVTWVSMHGEGKSVKEAHRFRPANRGFIIREWKARLGGKDGARPWLVEHSSKPSISTIDVVPPPGLKQLEAGDYLEATIEHVILPRHAADYYGPNQALRIALAKSGNTWKMMHRQAVEGERKVTVQHGALVRTTPDIWVRAGDDGVVEFTLDGGLGHVPVTFGNLASHRGYTLTIDGKVLDQSVHGNDFWQTDYDPNTKRWSRTYNVPAASAAAQPRKFQFEKR